VHECTHPDCYRFFNKNCVLRSVSVFMVPDVNQVHSKLWELREWTIIRSVLYRNWYWVYRIESYWLLLYQGKPNITCITAGSAAVNGLHYTLRSKALVPCHPGTPGTRTPFDRPNYGRGMEGWEEEGDCNLTPDSPWHQESKMAQYWVLATSDRWRCTPSTSRQWWRQSQLLVILTLLRINQS